MQLHPRPLLALSLLLPSVALGAPTPLTWDECVEVASRNNADLRVARSNLESSEDLRRAARSPFLPQLSASLAYSRGSTTVNNAATGAPSTTAMKESYTASLNGTQNLFNGFQDAGKLRQTGANADASRSAYGIALAKASFELKSAYEGAVYALDYAKLNADIIHRREENLAIVRLRFQSGLENKGSVLLSEAYLNQAHYDDLQSKHALRSANYALAKAMGLDELGDREVAGHVPTQDPAEAAPDFRALALGTPDVAQADAQARASDAAVTIARSSFFPTLNLTGSIGRLGADFFPNERDTWSAGLNLSLPFFAGGKDYFGLGSASAQRASADANRDSVARGTLVKVENAYDDYVESAEKLKVDESFRVAATARAEIARKKYNNGLLTFDDWDVIETDLINRQKTYLQSKRDRVISEATWEQARGKGVIP